MSRKGFMTPGRFAADQTKGMVPPRGRLLIASCRSGAFLFEKVTGQYRRLPREDGSQSGV